jgi:hypothetical protein
VNALTRVVVTEQVPINTNISLPSTQVPSTLYTTYIYLYTIYTYHLTLHNILYTIYHIHMPSTQGTVPVRGKSHGEPYRACGSREPVRSFFLLFFKKKIFLDASTLLVCQSVGTQTHLNPLSPPYFPQKTTSGRRIAFFFFLFRRRSEATLRM